MDLVGPGAERVGKRAPRKLRRVVRFRKVRGNDVLEAHHDTIVQAEDHLILFVTDRRQIQQVERLFRT